ncbi:MAG: hypothetical protein EP343_34605 [Deltaproteobacteria bacterium]|nr:MAG: hypothetical protein EP343_34605 [Deltaproteobacteria bacterium]
MFQALESSGWASLMLLAEHALAGGHPSAPELIHAAGQEAESIYAFKAAADLYGRAALLLESREDRCDAMIARARSLVCANGWVRLALPH